MTTIAIAIVRREITIDRADQEKKQRTDTKKSIKKINSDNVCGCDRESTKNHFASGCTKIILVTLKVLKKKRGNPPSN